MKHYFSFLARVLFLLPFFMAGAHADVPVLMYHHISTSFEPSHTAVSPAVFEQHMQILHQAGYKTITIGELAKRVSKKNLKAEKLVAITFDDGWRDSLTAVDIMKRYGFSGTFYVLTNTFNTPSYMSIDDIKALSKTGNEIGAHSHTHFLEYMNDLSKIPLAVMVGEALLSRTILEDILNKPVVSFAWPFGIYTDEAVTLINKGGFTSSVLVNRDSMNNNSSDPMRLHRLSVDGNFSAETVLQMVTTGKAP